MIRKITLFVGILSLSTAFINAQCELTDNSLFTGDYTVTQITPSIFGYDTFSQDGNPITLTLFSGVTDASQSQPDVTLPDNVRSFDATYLNSLDIGNPVSTFAVEFTTNCEVTFSSTIVPEIANSTGLQCATGIFIGPAAGGVYTTEDDETFLLVFEDDVTGDCGAPVITSLQFDKESLSTNDNRLSNFKHWVLNKELNFSNNNSMDTATIYDLTGKLISNLTVNSNKGALDLTFLNSGLYVVKFNSGSFSKTIKIVVD